MTRRGKQKRPKQLKWGEFERHYVVFQGEEPMGLPDGVEYYQNELYGVFKRCASVLQNPGEWPAWWLSIKSMDRNPCHDWRHFQKIKNDLIGKEHEAVEVYPAESRLVDTSNQYHLFVLKDPAIRFPFGYTERLVLDKGDVQITPGAIQRKQE